MAKQPQFKPLAAGGRVAPRADAKTFKAPKISEQEHAAFAARTHAAIMGSTGTDGETKTRSVKIRATINVPVQFQGLTPGEIGNAFIRALEDAKFEVVWLSAKNIEEEA